MIASIWLNEVVDIDVNRRGEFCFAGPDRFAVNMNIATVPFVRVNFQEYSRDTLEKLAVQLKKFRMSVPIFHFNTRNVNRQVIEDIDSIIGKDSYAKFLYVPISDEDVQRADLSDEGYDILYSVIDNVKIDRIIMFDSSNTLTVERVTTMVAKIAQATGIGVRNIALCGSVLSLGNPSINMNCLCAITARELLTMYSKTDTPPLPTEKHQDMGTCSCVRHFMITSQNVLSAPAIESSTSEKRADGKNDGGSSDSGKPEKEKDTKVGKSRKKGLQNFSHYNF